MILAVSFNTTEDISAAVPVFEHGAVLRTDQITSYPGGKALNAARALSILGSKVFLTGICGSESLQRLENFCAQYGIKASMETAQGSNRICLIINESEKHSETVINSESSFPAPGKPAALVLKKIQAQSKKSSFVLFSGSLPSGLPADFYAKAIEKISDRKKVMIDASGRYLFHAIKAGPGIVKINLKELEDAFSVNLKSMAKLEKFAALLSSKYKIWLFIVTLGESGAMIYSSGKHTYHPPCAVKNIVSPVGSGDAFAAGLLYGLSNNMGIAQSAKWANAAAAANLSSKGACFFTKEDVLNYL
ncbi:MAG TPA: PfkB family carbohydrate kinase [Candidatus Goldiibacteriota bacterium]|nr:PfkB family carbohydrate kinase [Candidatus Goldiibacteriota bacterium]HPN64459.1 PfkB family carbohydrate kinase [Candidatus Goldiibacteriota bacterium]HRQ44365.1 PfkB family carbohydrate kinase [Candidatus Goldiibacteriota bacterium]